MKSLKNGRRRVRAREKIRTANGIFMSMNLPAEVVRGINRKMRKAS
ncbi:MAG: hypothetical protein PHH77_05240 [Victivallaceae bacterium]|nr:hypothetical protein [Victivallaceae bacterium]